MHPSCVFKSSLHCSASPNGSFIATLSSSSIVIRSVRSLQTVHSVKLPGDFSGPISTLAWALSSKRLLVANADQIHVFSATDSSFHATIRNPVGGSGKSLLVKFGARDAEILIYAAFGLKLVIFDLSTSKAVEINNPKLYLPASISRGLSFQPHTQHLALLTRASGRDVVSIHHPVTRQIQRSWYPDTADAQGLTWTPDGNWLLLWESPAHGHKLLLYTPDGQFFRSIGAANLAGGDDADLEPGIKLCSLSPDSALCAVGDYSRGVQILNTRTWRTDLSLLHPTTLIPKDTLQVWQEQLGAPVEGHATRTFIRATQMVSPPSRLGDGKSGCSSFAFDASSTLIATKLDDSPSTLWIWDVSAGELRAVLMFHSTVNFDWHPAIRELLLVTCQDENHRGVSFVWDPLTNGPEPVLLEAHLPDGKLVGKTQSVWINGETESPVLLISDAQRYLMMSCADAADQCPTPWHEPGGNDRVLGSAREASSYDQGIEDADDLSALLVDDTSTLDDTFSFKNP
ncbi:WD40-repeat-containing domain protein [Thelonectria olida]|uniref:WD40-repeat-containing domain protein n=1 Tax=Thelonectria olida TaxID=1576542 RepID=A0A9P9AVA7_9HYPO|nr:WD40-repeat-containing domain protein [Thelonectria olida]